MKRTILFLTLIATPAMAQNGKWNVTTPQPYTRTDFERDCIKMAPDAEPARAQWIARCRKDTP